MGEHSTTTDGAPPELFEYLDYRAFLRDWFESHKAANPRFSHRVFARMTRQSSPSLLAQVIKGRRNLTDKTLPLYCRALGLKGDEADYFRLLVELDSATSAEERTSTFERICSNRRFRNARPIDGESFRYLSTWYLVAVRELAACPGFVADPAWISRQLTPRITVAQAADALKTLVELGLLVSTEDGGMLPADTTVATPHEVGSLAVYNHHKAMIDLAHTALDRIHGSERHIGSVTVAASHQLLGVLKKEIGAFQERILEICDGAAVSPDRVFQVNLQLFPLTEIIEEP